jgi:hypothetical protein
VPRTEARHPLSGSRTRTASADPAALIASAVAALPPAQQTEFYALSYAGLSPRGVAPHVFAARLPLAIFETNAVAAGSAIGLFPRMARMNHACAGAANAVYAWREDERVLVTHALRAIDAGEEVLTTYIATRRPRAERQCVPPCPLLAAH